MPEFRMTFIVIQQQTGMFANASDAAEESQEFSWEGATIQTVLEQRDPQTWLWCLVAPSPAPPDHVALLEEIVMMQDGDVQSQRPADTVAHLADVLASFHVTTAAAAVQRCLRESSYWLDRAHRGESGTTTSLTPLEAAINYLAMASDLAALSTPDERRR